MAWIRKHFQRYRERRPWEFCWRIAVEGTLVSVGAALLLSILGCAERKIGLGFPAFLFIGVIIAPPLETLIFQALPVWIARLFKARFSVQVVSSVVPFFLVHVVEGAATGIAAGLVGGFYFAFTYVHWREQRRWTAFWTTAVSHAIHNSILISLAWAVAEL